MKKLLYTPVKKDIITKTLESELIRHVINEAIGNWTQNHFKKQDPEIIEYLINYSKIIIEKSLNYNFEIDINDKGWKDKLSNHIDELFKKENMEDLFKQELIILTEKFVLKIGDIRESGLHKYSLSKIARYSSLVSAMVENNLPPDLLKMTQEEITKEQKNLIKNLLELN